MRRWVRVEIPRLRCGRCTRTFAVGDPMCLVGQAELRRCEDCAGPAPDLPPLYVPPRDPDAKQPTVSRRGNPALPSDGKAAAAGE